MLGVPISDLPVHNVPLEESHMQRRLWSGLLALVCVLGFPSLMLAQSSIAGQVKDE
jgi:hypothetical protein